MVKNPPAKQETQLQSLGQEGYLEKEMATHFSIHLGNPGDIGAWGVQSIVLQRVGIDLVV